MPMRARFARAAALLAAAVTSCAPLTHGYATIPVTTADGAGLPLAIVDLNLVELARHFDAFDPSALAIYHRGRSPIPHTLEDSDGDGDPNFARVKLPIEAGRGTEIVVTCPGPRAEGEPAIGGTATGVVVRYKRIRH